MKLRSRIALWILLILSFFSLTAELWSNDRPIVMSYNGHLCSPLVSEPTPQALGLKPSTQLQIHYPDLVFKESDWALWPVNRWNPLETDRALSKFPAPPDRHHWLGADDRGRDVFARLLYGFRSSLLYAFLVWSISSLAAMLVGGICGYYGSKVDLFGQRVIEVLSTIPQFLVLIFLISVLQPSLAILAVVTAGLGWMGLSRYVRSEALRCRQLEFIEAARTLGATDRYILLKHILPNAMSPILSFAPFVIASHLIGLAALSYLGFGPPPPSPSWGEILQQGQKYFGVAWWLTVFPAMAFFVTLLSLTFASLGLRERPQSEY